MTLDPPGSTWQWFVTRPPLGFSLTLGCKGTAAVAHLTGPPWADFDLTEVEQDLTLCNPIPRTRWAPFKLRMPSLLEVLLLTAAGMVLESRVDLIP